jgi:hypothetical protein
MRLSVSPATPFWDASLPNHTKMFELVHVVTSVDTWGVGGAGPRHQRQSLIFNICEQALALILKEGRSVGERLDPATTAEPNI